MLKMQILKLMRFFKLISKSSYSKKIKKLLGPDYAQLKISGLFDCEWYLNSYPDVKTAKIDPVLHYLKYGWKEGRNPSKNFNTMEYLHQNPDVEVANINPLLHYELVGRKEGRIFNGNVTDYPNGNKNEYIDYLFNMYNDKSHFVEKIDYQPQYNTSLKLIAFYLPQYHLFKENEEWHGRGFTEWSNVTKVVPHFIGHRQPQLPIDVGFYDLANIDVMKRQTELAKQYGIHGSCFHYYWFSGKKLMEKPIYNYLEHTEIDFPFCLCWANENWSKLWDGGNKEVLIQQEYKEDDDEAFARDIIPFFKDKRYIKIKNKPLFIVYRPALFKQKRFCKFVDVLRRECKKADIEDLYILASNSFNFKDNPKCWHVNGIVEFPPHGIIPKKIQKTLIFNQSNINIVDCAEYINSQKFLYETPYNVFKTVFPSWDNTARKAYTGATCFYGETPRLYRKWLEDCIRWTKIYHSEDEQLVFINAWNEWAEGAHLEPDTYYGYAYLNETKIALENDSIKLNKTE